eukprot:4536861-Alexandrium_andersonii.AAC.1
MTRCRVRAAEYAASVNLLQAAALVPEHTPMLPSQCQQSGRKSAISDSGAETCFALHPGAVH